MAYCKKCGKKIGLFQTKHNYSDKYGNTIIYCSLCKEEFEYKEKEKRLLLIKKETEKRFSQIKPILEKYFSKCDMMKKIAIGRLYSVEEIYENFEDESIENVKEYLVGIHSKLEDAINSRDYEDLDTYMKLKNVYEISFDFLDDLEKIFKLLKKKKVDTNFPELIELFHNLYEDYIKQENEVNIKAEYKRISNKLGKNITIKSVLKEFIKTPLDHDVDAKKSILLLERFDLEFEEDKLPELIEELKEEVELENFEDHLGEKKLLSLPDYQLLNGHQFESFLKKLFEALDFVVVHTKLSGDQGADLIIMKDGEKTAVQAKKYSGKVSNKAIQEVVASKKYYQCNNSMVVTTGEFTNSAIELAISNKVELWDKNKLQKIVNEVNNSSNNSLKRTHEASLKENAFPISCPFCSAAQSIPIENIPRKSEKSEMDCSECGISISFQCPEINYLCSGCKKEFEIFKERIEHSETCKKYKERQFNCQHCKVEFVLDDSDLAEIQQNRSIEVDCPTCNRANVLKLQTHNN